MNLVDYIVKTEASYPNISNQFITDSKSCYTKQLSVIAQHFSVCAQHRFLQCLNVFMLSRYPTEFVINLAAISHIKKLISFRPQIIRTLIFIPASIRLNMWLAAAVLQPPLSFFHLSFCPSETFQIPLMFLLCSNFKTENLIGFTNTHSPPKKIHLIRNSAQSTVQTEHLVRHLQGRNARKTFTGIHYSLCSSTDIKAFNLAVKKS